jgi:hypothetical protein
MKPNSSWSLKQNENAPAQPKPAGSAGGAASGAGGPRGGTPLLEQRILWFLAAKAPEKRANVTELAEGLAVAVEEARAVTRGMVRKAMLRELPKGAGDAQSRFTVGPRLLAQAATLAAGPDPVTM